MNIDTARKIIIDWFHSNNKTHITPERIADILDDFEKSDIDDLEIYLATL